MNKLVRYLIAIFLIILINHIALFWLPWYLIMPITAILCYIFMARPAQAAIIGFLALFISWATLAYIADVQNNSILSGKIGELFGGLSSTTLWIVTGLIGGIGGLIGGWLGGLLTIQFPLIPEEPQEDTNP